MAERHDDSDFRAALHRAADLVADYVAGSDAFPVLSRLEPGAVRAQLPPSPPEQPEPFEALLADYQRLILPGTTHWNHPGFLAYFATTGSEPGILGELLTAGLNVQAMLWRTGPAATELEEHVCDWLRQMLGLPPAFRGHINDTASMSTLLAIAAARHRATGGDVRDQGNAGRRFTVYASEHAHSSIDKALLTLGLGLESLRRIPVDGVQALRPEALADAIAADRRGGATPIAVMPTVGTTATTAVDPVAQVAEIAREHRLWLHVDAAYAGPAALCEELRPRFAGWERADSIVVNPHKWLFTPMDCSVLLLREPEALKAAFALTPDYLVTTERGVTNLMDYGPQLGRRFRALKLWFVIRRFGVAGLRARLRAHVALAREFAAWVEADPGFEVCAPVPFSVVVFRAKRDDAFNERLLAEVNAAGPVFLSGTKLGGRAVLRLAIGNERTERRHVAAAWTLVRATAEHLAR